MQTDKPYSVRLPKAVGKHLERDAKTEHLSVSDILRRILLRHYGLLEPRPN